jgi:cytochrome c-type biogenesis protein CcmH/NrfF
VNTSKKTWVLWLLIGVPVVALIVVAVIVVMRNRS